MKKAHPACLSSTRAASFDFDETIIDLERQHDAAHRALCLILGSDYDQLPEGFRFGSGRRIVDDIDTMRRFFGWREERGALHAIRHRHFLEEIRNAELALMPGVERVIRLFARRGYPLAVTTSADGGAVDELLARFGIRDAFAVIIDGTRVRAGKPDPEAYLVTARELGVEPQRCVVFEDSEPGVQSAKSAGACCIAVRNPNARQWQELSKADLVLDSFEAFDEEAVPDLTSRR